MKDVETAVETSVETVLRQERLVLCEARRACYSRPAVVPEFRGTPKTDTNTSYPLNTILNGSHAGQALSQSGTVTGTRWCMLFQNHV